MLDNEKISMAVTLMSVGAIIALPTLALGHALQSLSINTQASTEHKR